MEVHVRWYLPLDPLNTRNLVPLTPRVATAVIVLQAVISLDQWQHVLEFVFAVTMTHIDDLDHVHRQITLLLMPL